MAITRKFLFDTSFDEAPFPFEAPPEPDPIPEPDPEPPAPPEPTFTQEDLLRAHEDGYNDGFTAGRQAAENAATARLAAALEAVGRQLADALERGEREAAARQDEAVRIGLAIARKLLPATARRHGLAEIEAMLADCVASSLDEPRLTVCVAEADHDAVRERLDALAETRGFTGKVVLLAEPRLAPGDCRVEWSDGGVERDTGRLWQDIDRIAERHLAGPLGEPAGEPAEERRPETTDA